MKTSLLFLFLQVQHSAEMTDAAGTGKYDVVIGVIGIVFACIVAYLISLDLKLRKLENKK